MDRSEALLSYADVSTECGLEIGPLDKALVKRKDGRRIYYCDYATREDLQKKSAGDPNVQIDLIPEIDFVSSKITSETFGRIKFDYVVASHVIEHVPDIIGWLAQLLNVLNPGGRIILAVPDRRYTFDYLRPVSTVGEMVQAHLEQRSRPSFAQVYEGFSKAVRAETPQCWKRGPYPGPLEPHFTKELALNLARDAHQNGAYHDCHCWVFEHETFLDNIDEIKEIGVLNIDILHHSAPVYGANEFHAVLGTSHNHKV